MGIIIRQSIKGTIVNYIGSFLGFLTTMFVLTKFLQPEEIGLTKVLYEVALFVSSFAMLGASASAYRFFPYFKNGSNGNNGFFFYLLLLPTIGLLIFIPLYILLRDPVSIFFSKNAALFVDYYYWVIPLIVFSVYWKTLEAYSTLQMRIVVPKLIREVLVRLLLMAVYLLFAFKYLNMNGLIGCFIAVYGIAMLLTFLYIPQVGSISLKHDFSFIDPPLRRKIRNYTLFVIFSTLSGGLLGQLDIFMVSSQIGLEYAGIYTVAFYIATIIEIPARSISSISAPVAASALKENDLETANQLYKKVALHQLIAGSCVFLLIWINIDNIFAIIPKGNVYSEGKWVVFFIALSKLISITLGFGSTLIFYSKYYYWGLFFTIFITVVGIGTNLLLIPRIGITGAAIATLVTCILNFSVQQWLVLLKIKGNPYSIGMIKQGFLLFILFLINFALPQWIENPFIDGIYRTLIVGTIAVISLYKFKISEELYLIMHRYMKAVVSGRFK